MMYTWRSPSTRRPVASIRSGSAQPEFLPGRRRARLSDFLVALALLAGTLSLFLAAPAEAQSRVLVSNIDQPAFVGAQVGLRGTLYAQGFTTGSNSTGYLLESIEIGIRRSVGQRDRVRAEV